MLGKLETTTPSSCLGSLGPLNNRFQQAHLQRTAGAGVGGAAASTPGSLGKKRSQGTKGGRGRRALQSMEIDREPHSGGPAGRRGGRGGSPSRRGGRRGTGRGGRAGRGGGRRGRAPPNKDKLDMDLDNYMLGDSKTGRSILDNDLDKYMSNATA